MSDNLAISGELSETTVPDLIRSIVRSSETAILTLDTPNRSDTIYFHEGRMIYASSTDPDMGLAETLLRSGDLSIQQYNTAMERLLVARRIGGLLCELGYLHADELTRVAEGHATAIVLDAMAYRHGTYTIEFTDEFPDGIITLPLPTERLILDGVRRVEYWSLIVRGVGRLERMLEQVPGADTRVFQLELTEDETHVLNLLSDAESIADLCARSYLSNFQTVRTIWGLLAVNLVQDAEVTVVDEKRAAVESEYELEALVEKYNDVFQRVFALVFQKIGDHVYDFMDRVTLHLSPETLPYLSGMNFVNEGRLDFDQLLNNLYASGSSDHGKVVATVLNELLYGWVYEIKSEFHGQPIASEVMVLADGVKRN
jgi:hypothetical protein